MYAVRCCLVLLFIIVSFSGIAQIDGQNWNFKGYIKDLQMIYYAKPLEEWTNQNLMHNRLNFHWYASFLSFSVEMRNRLFSGKLVHDFPNYVDLVDRDNGFWNLSCTLAQDREYILHSIIDRAYVDFSRGNWQVRFGRQRLNWGMNLIWNPNDLFNTYSFLDFDYEERPGTDALLVQYYIGATSWAELVYELGDELNDMALAGRFRFNHWNYDFQFLGGWVEKDMVVGVGWAGDIKGGGFRGEISWFTPRKDYSDDVWVVSLSGDYSFKNNLYLQLGGLYNSTGSLGKVGSVDIFNSEVNSPKQLSRGRYALYGQMTYPVTPLWNSDLSAIANPSDGSFYLGPSMSYSILQNIDIMLLGQLFFGEKNTEYGDIGKVFYLRIKWSF